MATINTAVQTFTDAELLALNRKAQAEIYAYGSSVGGNGRTLTRADLAALQEAESRLEQRIASATSDTGGMHALVQFGDQR